METPIETKKRNDGYSAKRIREILGIKQEELAERMGVSQRSVSKLEATEILKDDQLEAIAKALHVPVDAIKNFTDDATLNIIVNALHDNSSIIQNYYPTFNTVDKVVELYERMLQAEQEKIALLQEVLKEKK